MDINNTNDFEQLYLLYYPKLVRFSKEYVLSEEEAENIVQDVFLFLCKQKSQLSYIQHIPSYLLKLTKNKCIDFLRHKITSAETQQRLHEIQIHEFEYRLRSMEQFDDNILYEKELNSLIQEAIQSLPERCREIFMLSRFRGLSHQEIADKFEISPNTVNSQISQALKRLKEQLKDYFYLFFFL
ncbi:RNA polymerase sigma-70 factor [Parabacteroides sp. Marseille-P3160]|mgnify:CR=1 FL=1|uniref:RNA polymerase sigma-70 factor n=1 Tax=Parabacteroides sp. Marseille-P3160 TaxID=1917887 RepID=UPI0009BA32E9|nr:RNA polymerase sigma-70 factor [Parabacteroides sp. Marseille-P3160]